MKGLADVTENEWFALLSYQPEIGEKGRQISGF
jgi:hypothetical protein